MAKKPFHLAWFLSQGYGPKTWRTRWPGSDLGRWMMPDIFIDLAKGLDRGGFDYMIIEDSSNLPYTYQGSHDTYLKYAASTPKLDPAVLVPYLAAHTKHLGLVPTLSVTEYPPYLLARLVNSLDHVAGVMQELMEEVGGDGFLIFNSYFDRRYIVEVCDGLVPELQRRGLTRKAYAHKHLRDNLLEF